MKTHHSSLRYYINEHTIDVEKPTYMSNRYFIFFYFPFLPTYFIFSITTTQNSQSEYQITIPLHFRYQLPSLIDQYTESVVLKPFFYYSSLSTTTSVFHVCFLLICLEFLFLDPNILLRKHNKELRLFIFQAQYTRWKPQRQTSSSHHHFHYHIPSYIHPHLCDDP